MSDRHLAPAHPVVPPAPSPIDLHTHSTRSDGVLPPAVLARDAAAVGVRLLALTDHDTLAGSRELLARGVPDGLELIPGVEINTLTPLAAGLGEGEVHILGLGVDVEDESFEATLAAQRDQRRIRFERTLVRLRELGYPVDEAAAQLGHTHEDALGRPTVARLLVETGHASSVQDAFSRLLSHGRPAYVPRGGLDPTAAIRAIERAGGIPVLAHFSEASERLDVVRELIERGLGGLEVYYAAWNAETVERVRRVAESLSLVPTGGSDYHGDTGSYADAHAALWVPAAVGESIHRAIERAAA